jgi:hypothetical protein
MVYALLVNIMKVGVFCMVDIGYFNGTTKKYPFVNVVGVCGDNSMYWSAKDFTLLSTYVTLTERLEITESSKILFSLLFPLHPVEDVISTGTTVAKAMASNHRALLGSAMTDLLADLQCRNATNYILPIKIDWDETAVKYLTNDYMPFSGRDAFMALCYFNSIVTTKKKATVLYEKFSSYLLNYFGIEVDAPYMSVIRTGNAFKETAISTELPIINYNAAPISRVRGDFTKQELSIVFNNCDLTDDNLLNLLPWRTIADIQSIRILLEVVMYNRGIEDFSKDCNFSMRNAVYSYTENKVILGDALKAFNAEFWGIPAVSSVSLDDSVVSAISAMSADTGDTEPASLAVKESAKSKKSTGSKSKKSTSAKTKTKSTSSDTKASTKSKTKTATKEPAKSKTKKVVTAVSEVKATDSEPVKPVNDSASLAVQAGLIYNDIINIYSTGVPWTYAELVFLV